MPAIDAQTRGLNGLTGITLRLNPAAGTIIKEERDAVVWRQILPDGIPAVLKLYRHRKLLWFKQRGWYTSRAEREFHVLSHAMHHGIACSAPLFWAVGRTEDKTHYELLATREVCGAKDFKNWLMCRRSEDLPDLKPLFALVASLHRSGIQHGALFARNVLFAGCNFHLIDFPRSHRYGSSIEGRRAGWFDIKLLLQSMTKHLPDAPLIAGLAEYPHLPDSAETFVRNIRRTPIKKLQLSLLRDFHFIQSRWSRLFSTTPVNS